MDFYPTVFLLMKTYSSFCLAATKKREKKLLDHVIAWSFLLTKNRQEEWGLSHCTSKTHELF